MEQPSLVSLIRLTAFALVQISTLEYLEYFRRNLLGEGRLCEWGGGDEPDWDDVFRPLVSHHRGRRMSHVTVVQNDQRVN